MSLVLNNWAGPVVYMAVLNRLGLLLLSVFHAHLGLIIVYLKTMNIKNQKQMAISYRSYNLKGPDGLEKAVLCSLS